MFVDSRLKAGNYEQIILSAETASYALSVPTMGFLHKLTAGLTLKTRIIRNSLKNSSTDSGRASRFFDSDRRINWENSGVTFELSASNEGGVDLRCLPSRSFVLVPVNGGFPERTSWMVQAKL